MQTSDDDCDVLQTRLCNVTTTWCVTWLAGEVGQRPTTPTDPYSSQSWLKYCCLISGSFLDSHCLLLQLLNILPKPYMPWGQGGSSITSLNHTKGWTFNICHFQALLEVHTRLQGQKQHNGQSLHITKKGHAQWPPWLRQYELKYLLFYCFSKKEVSS